MKKLTTGLLVLVLSSSIAVAHAQEKKDTIKTKEIEGVVVTALGIKREKKSLGYAPRKLKQVLFPTEPRIQEILRRNYPVR